MNRPLRKLFYLLLTGVISAGMWLIWNSFTNSNKRITINRPVSEPIFRKDGQLFFFDPNTQDTLQQIDIEIVKKTEDIIQGMMFRSSLDESTGMLFLFSYEDEHSFWMKNTKISLDIIFIDKNLEILTIADHRIPYSTDPIPSNGPIQYVVEVNAGFCEKYGILPGHKVTFNQDE